MARPLRIEYPGAFYHVTSRGNEQRDVFKSKKDREQFLSYLESAVARYGAVIHSYCLMNNHYHLLMETPVGNLSQIMRHINGAYTTYFNTKRKRSGHLFQGRYKAILVEVDRYATELSRYIHLNPVRAGITSNPEEHLWSSYRQTIGMTETAKWLTTSFVLGYFDGEDARDKYRKFVNDAITMEISNPLQNVIASTILGSNEFVREKSQELLGERKGDRNIPAVRILNRPTIDEIIEVVKNEVHDESLAKKVGIYFCHRHSGARLREIGERSGLSEAAITQASRRFRLEYESNETVRRIVGLVEAKLNMSVVET
ncbi:MAG: transposase [Desulfuromonadaceae bacterium]|nr:transposase [Desulfuromonadaceae bacterium]